jgi:hypothetical protein
MDWPSAGRLLYRAGIACIVSVSCELKGGTVDFHQLRLRTDIRLFSFTTEEASIEI